MASHSSQMRLSGISNTTPVHNNIITEYLIFGTGTPHKLIKCVINGHFLYSKRVKAK